MEVGSWKLEDGMGVGMGERESRLQTAPTGNQGWNHSCISSSAFIRVHLRSKFSSLPPLCHYGI